MKIVFADNTEFICPTQAQAQVAPYPLGREWKKIDITATHAAAAAKFIDGVQYRQEWQSQTGEDENGQPLYETLTQNLSDYSIAGDIVDHRNGTVSIFMGKPTETEEMQAVIDTLLLDALGGAE